MSSFRSAGRAPAWISLAGTLSLLAPLLAPAAPAAPEIFKCTDASGNVTYQNEPCPKNTKAGRVDIFENTWTADRLEKEAQWQRNAAEHRVVTGMPGRWVREALGEPTEVRDTATAGASEVWVYNRPDRSVQVGMLKDQVLWFREAPVPASPARAASEAERVPDKTEPQATRSAPTEPQVARSAPAPDRPPELPVTRLAPPTAEGAARDASRNRATAAAEPAQAASSGPNAVAPARAVARGQDCKEAIAKLGPPDRRREISAADGGSDPATEYFYEPSGSAGSERVRVVCSKGKVEGVDRTIVR